MPLRLRGPVGRDAARRRGQGKQQQQRASGQREHRGGLRLRQVSTGVGGQHAGRVQRRQRVVQPWSAPVEHVVVGRRAGIDAPGGQAAHMCRMHAVVDA